MAAQRPSLFTVAKDNYGSSYEAHLFETYKLFVNTTESASQRRLTANSFFLTLNSALVGFTSYIPAGDLFIKVPILSAVGVLVSYSWFLLIKSYRNLNRAKFTVIHAIEERLPVSAFTEEWLYLGEGKKLAKYLGATHIEVVVPLVFLFFHFAVVVYTILAGLVET